VPIYRADSDGRYPLEFLVSEYCVSNNTAASGGNATLMMIE
jgi:delta 1-pyrroline-5-carboxylate dehydrogenase